MTYKEHKIPKKHGKFRHVCAPSADLLEYQQSKLPRLEDIYNREVNDRNLENIAHGFRTNKNCITGARLHIGFDLTIMLDLKEFFDNVKTNHIAFNEISSDEYLFHKEGHAAQGFATSPMIANIATIPAIEHINTMLNFLYPNNYAFTIYADDIQISINRNNKKIKGPEEQFIIDNIYQIFEGMDLPMNKKKTRIRYAQHGWRKILGVNVGNTEVRATRKVMKKIRAAAYQGNYQSQGGLTTWSRCLLPKAIR